MIKFGFNTIAMLTWGLGINRPRIYITRVSMYKRIQFKDKPAGIAVEDKTGPMSFEDVGLEFEDESIKFKDR